MISVGIDVGGTKCLGVALAGGSGGGTVAGEVRAPTPAEGSALLGTLARLVRALATETGDEVSAVGLGVPGLADRDGVVRFAPNLRSAVGLNVRDGLSSLLGGLPVMVDNDATCATWGEHEAGAGRGKDDMVLVTLGTGIGGGFVCGGSIQRGANGYAGELGHLVVDPSGPPCPCGRRGCWERYASGSGLGRLAREAAAAGAASCRRIVQLAGGDPDSVRGEHVTLALAEDDAGAVEIMAEFAQWLALGLANLVNVFDPEVVVVGGGLVEAGAALLDPARAALARELAGQEARPAVPIVPAQLGERAGAVGAAFLAR